MSAMFFEQSLFVSRFEWGMWGLSSLCPNSDVVVIVDVLSFSTCVEIATARGAMVFPYHLRDASALRFAQRVGAELAESRGMGRYSLSPASFVDIPAGSKVVLPSPNGASLSLATFGRITLAGCLRNATAVARAARRRGRRVAVIAAGERWPDGSLRPCLEDWLGAGAILDQLDGSSSPEAVAAVDVFRASMHDLRAKLCACGSGRELIDGGYEEDVLLASELNVSDCVPRLAVGAYRNESTSTSNKTRDQEDVS